MVDISTEIWDYLYKHGPTSLTTIAGALGHSLPSVEEAVAHEWFAVQSEVASIAIQQQDVDAASAASFAPPAPDRPRSDAESRRILGDMFKPGESPRRDTR